MLGFCRSISRLKVSDLPLRYVSAHHKVWLTVDAPPSVPTLLLFLLPPTATSIGTMDSSRNIYKREIDFRALALASPEFAKRYCSSALHGCYQWLTWRSLKSNDQLDFSDPDSIRYLCFYARYLEIESSMLSGVGSSLRASWSEISSLLLISLTTDSALP